ncbi:DUF3046 domain-containing protein [Microbacterium sp.]|uniref:DUF3046 domain-containing protein n=1 Tax=Microbacterium sp. TaxID=51671 RepID=UPI003A870EA9
MRLSEFDRAVEEEFGARAGSILHDLTLAKVGYRTAAEAMRAGVPPREVWLALCDEADVPPARRYGAGLRDPRR